MPESRNMLTGRILAIQQTVDGYPQIQLDNGPVRRINLVTPQDVFPVLTAADMQDIHAHLMTKTQGRYRRK